MEDFTFKLCEWCGKPVDVKVYCNPKCREAYKLAYPKQNSTKEDSKLHDNRRGSGKRGADFVAGVKTNISNI